MRLAGEVRQKCHWAECDVKPVVFSRPAGARPTRWCTSSSLGWMDGAFAAVDISLPGQDLYPIARLPAQLEMKSGRNGAEVVGGGGQERVEVVSPSGVGMSYSREDPPMEGQDCSYVGTP